MSDVILNEEAEDYTWTSVMDKLFLFTDGSVDTKSKTGFGAYLFVTDTLVPVESLSKQIRVRRFNNTSSARLELETIIWAFREIKESADRFIVYTDSQNIVGLKGRRERLEKNKFLSGKSKPLKNADLYIQFYKITDRLNCEFIKVQGHIVSHKKDQIDKLFTLVDRESRNALRKYNRSIDPII